MKCFSFNVKDTFILFLVTGLFISISGHAQNFTTNADGNWSNEGNWDRTNPNGCGTLANYPRTSTYDPQCQVDVTIEHHINFDVNTTFGGGALGMVVPYVPGFHQVPCVHVQSKCSRTSHGQEPSDQQVIGHYCFCHLLPVFVFFSIGLICPKLQERICSQVWEAVRAHGNCLARRRPFSTKSS